MACNAPADTPAVAHQNRALPVGKAMANREDRVAQAGIGHLVIRWIDQSLAGRL